MPVDDRDDAKSPTPPDAPPETVSEALQSKTDKPLPPVAERIAERDADRTQPVTPQGQRRRYLTRRNAFLATLAIFVIVAAIVIVAFLAYRLGYVDRYVANQITDTLAEYGIRTEIKYFHTAFSPRTVEMRGIEFYDAKTDERLGKADRMLATVRIEDLYAINLRRNINLEKLEIDNFEAWVKFDDQGRSNFRNIHIPPPVENERIVFSYATALIKLNSAVVHYGDELHRLSGEARNIHGTVQPDDLNAPAASRMNRVDLWLANSTFVYDGRPVNNIDIEVHGRVDETRAEIHDLTLRSPVAEAHLQGTLDDWRAMRYRLQIASAQVDLTQASDILQTGMSLRGVGNINGTVAGEGSRYKIEDGSFKSDALAADNIRLKALNLSARGTGDGKSYDLNGRAVAELLTAGDFQLNSVQLAGGIMGTGTDFRWLGELRAAAARGPGTTIAGLILSDAVAEMRDKVLTASARSASANKINLSKASINGAQASGVRLRRENGVTTASVASVRAGTLDASGARVNGLTANDVDAVDRNGTTNVVAKNVRIGGLSAAGAQVGSLNIAGVRLAIHNGRIEGSSGDINAGTVQLARSGDFQGGRIEGVRLARPVFIVEPQGSYRASADLSLGGGVLGQVNLGAARAALVATNNQVQLNNFTADILNGRATGNAVVSTARGGASRVNANFSDLDIGKLVSLVSGRAMPVAGKATGTVDLAFPGTDVTAASGTARAEFTAETGDEASGRTPLTGAVALRADRGLFNIEQANLRTAASELKASGQFSVTRADSNLTFDLASSNATELRNVISSTGLLADVEQKLESYGIKLGGATGASEFEREEAKSVTTIEPAGKLTFNGTVRGKLNAPVLDARASLESVVVNGRELGALTAQINTTPDEVRITNGRLTQRNGGGAQFALNAPLNGKDNISIDATLDRADAANLVAVLPLKPEMRARLGEVRSDLSGRVSVKGLPDAMSGNADLRLGPGSVNGEPFESIIARATFAGANVNLETVDARFNAGRITANGTYNTTSQAFDLQARAIGIRLDRLASFTGNRGATPQLTGTADITEARATGIFTDFSTYQINFKGEGRDVTVNGRPAGTLTLVGRTENKQLNVTFTTGLLGQPQVVAARVDLGNELLPTTIETTLAGVNLQPLFAALMPQANVKVAGRATGTLRASGNLITKNAAGEEAFSLAGLQGAAEFTDLTIQIEDATLTAVSPLKVQFSTNEIYFEKTRFTGPGTNVEFGGRAALGPGGTQSMTVNGQLNLRVLNSLSPNLFLSGPAEVRVSVGGTYEQPRLAGRACIGLTGQACEAAIDTSNGGGASIATIIADERMTLNNVKGRILFNANQAEIQTLTGNLGGGRVTATGGVLLAGFVPTRFRLNVHGEDVVVPFPRDFRSTADADVEISGTRGAQIISGILNLRRSEYTKDIELADLINRRREASLTEGGNDEGETSLAATTQLDLRLEGRDALVVRNNLADMVGSVSLRVTGPANDPVIAGRITATRGTLNFRNDRYELTRAFIDLPGRRGADPLLNIQAESEIKGYRVLVGLTGPLSQPQAVVRSDPALPQADVVSLITTGNLSAGDTGGSVLAQSGVGTAASLITDTLINAPAQRATSKLFGLNRFEIDPLVGGRGGTSPTARLTVGRQINKNLSVTYSTNVTADQNQVLALEYRVSNRLSFIAQYEQGSTRSLTSRNDNFSFEIRFRRRF